eukprot:11303909-Prorocentrum_lima.AAC.1
MWTLKVTKEVNLVGPWEGFCNAVLGKVPPDEIVLPGELLGSPFHLKVLQVWDAYDGRNSQKKGWLNTKVGAMSLKSIVVKIGSSQGIHAH